MGCPKLTERDYYRLRNCTGKTSRASHGGKQTRRFDTFAVSPLLRLSGSYSQSPSYDDDGNMTQCSLGVSPETWSFTFNAENRLASMESASAKLEFSYDYMGRRVEKKVYSGTPGSWTLDEHSRFVYDGYLQIEKLDALNSNAVVRKRIWSDGKVICDIHGSTPYYALGDANKNLTEYLDASGAIQAHFEYSPFGKITVASGTDPDDFDFRFSSEVFEHETGLVYYNYRYYSPELGRWLTRDPIGEEGGENLYGFVFNSTVNTIDILGKMSAWEADNIRFTTNRPVFTGGRRDTGPIDANITVTILTLTIETIHVGKGCYQLCFKWSPTKLAGGGVKTRVLGHDAKPRVTVYGKVDNPIGPGSVGAAVGLDSGSVDIVVGKWISMPAGIEIKIVCYKINDCDWENCPCPEP